MAGEHSFLSLTKPFEFAAMALVGCTVGHILMYPLGLYEMTAHAGTWITGLFNPAAEGAAHAAGEILSSVDPTAFADCVAGGGITHPHGGSEMACII